MILATRDGGRTWWPLRSGGTRAALLGIFSEPSSTPFEMYAWHCANEGYLGVAQYINYRERGSSAEATDIERRAQEAVTAAGGSSANMSFHFPLRQEGLQPAADEIVEAWNRANDGDARDRLRQIRIWRPDVVVTEEAGAESGVAAYEISQAVLSAVERASDSTAFPEHGSLGALPPWRVRKVLCKQTRALSAVRLNTAQLAANLGASLDDYSAPARGLVFSKFVQPPDRWEFQMLVNTLPQDVGKADFFSGLQLSHGGEARRPPGSPATLQLDELGRRVQQRRNMERLISQDINDRQQGAALVGQLNDLTRDFPSRSVASVLYQLAMRYQRSGETELAAHALHRLVNSCPDQDLTDEALVWLVRYYASSEVAWRLRGQTRLQTQVVQTGAQQPVTARPGDPHAAQPALLRAVASDTVTVSGTAAPQWNATDRGDEALQLATFAAQTRPTLFARPDVRFPMAVAQKRLGLAREAESYFQQLVAAAAEPGWSAAAQAELWLPHGRGTPPKSIASSFRTSDRPRLDADLQDPVWQRARPLELRSVQRDDTAWPATAMLAFDNQFLYLALVCRRATLDSYPSASASRQRDQDLVDRDRVEIFLDMDRDYASYYRLTIDHRGWANDACCQDTHWNPRWFIAAADDGSSWTIEAAIPWSELGPAPPQHNDVWALGLQRVAPRTGFQSWTTPAAVEPQPQGFGLLIFQD
jgi:tetratricopeptide (TPR) repeat protein